jgi:hypothetical protein
MKENKEKAKNNIINTLPQELQKEFKIAIVSYNIKKEGDHIYIYNQLETSKLLSISTVNITNKIKVKEFIKKIENLK